MYDNKLGEYLKRCRGAESLRSFAQKCQISHTHLDSIEKGEDPRTGKPVSVSVETLKLIGTGIGVDYLFLACLADGIDPLTVRNIRIPDNYCQKVLQTTAKHTVLNQQFDLLTLEEKERLLGSEKTSSQNIALTDKEQDLIRCYRAASPEDRAIIDNIVSRYTHESQARTLA